MSVTRRDFFKLSSLAAIAAGAGGPMLVALRTASASTVISTDPTYHFLNRISWGVRPNDLERAQQIGIAAYLEEQLNPDSIKEKLKISKLMFQDRQRLRKMKNSHSKCREALIRTMLTRAVHSRRQLLERVVEFWSDHFNVTVDGFAKEMVGYQRDTIRPHALGNFRALLGAVAQSPAMLYYLDNFINRAEAPNENYARELMELHTLGVDGGYTEDDVKAVARAFTGWTVGDTPTGFYFSAKDHDFDAKTVLGYSLPAGRGVEDGEAVLDILAAHPSTAQFLSRKLCVRFVSDSPPQSLVDSTAAAWTQTSGDIKSVLRHIFLSAGFANSVGQKVRRPLDFFVSVLRATQTEVRDYWYLHNALEELGQLPYGWHPPNGYPEPAAAWINTGGLLARWNRALRLPEHALRKDKRVRSLIWKIIGKTTTVGELVDVVSLAVFGIRLSGEPREMFVAFASDDAGEDAPVSDELIENKVPSLFGLMLASPMNQWR